MDRLEAWWNEVARWARANPLTAALIAAIAALVVLVLPPGPWTLLELFKLAASLALPVALLLIGLRLERRKVANQELVRKRIAVYDDVAVRLNKMLCFFTAVGDWNNMNTSEIINEKREADRKMHVYRHLFSPRLFNIYKEFMDVYFQTYSDPAGGTPAKLRLDVDHVKRNVGPSWKQEWEVAIAGERERRSVDKHRAAYAALMKEFAKEIGVDE